MKTLEESIYNYPKLELIDVNNLYFNEFINMSEQAFYKAISRMYKSKKIIKVAKGIYCVPKITKYGVLSSGEDEITSYYLGENNGVLIAYKLYNKYSLTTQVPKQIEMYSNIIYENTKNVSNVKIKKANIQFTSNNIFIIELLEILENYKNIEDVNYKMLAKTLKYLAENYTEQAFNNVIQNIKYKKSTLASLKYLLDYFGIENSVKNHLRKTSKYKIIDLEKIYEFTS